MLRKALIAVVVATLGMALVSTDASARAGFRGAGGRSQADPLPASTQLLSLSWVTTRLRSP
jgi:hypothetical protein